ncbi:MAG TPA: ATP-binding protein, partial [Gemmatimonadaceae bacterium]|nr:ATP-binding protein [Gemmatimonadaceae bacterium]
CLDLQIADGARGARMPALILQPLVENAIRHGMSPTSRDTRIAISAAVGGGRLRVRVADPGAQNGAVANGADGAEGFGLRYVRERLHHYYRDDASLALATTGAGTVVTVDMPLAPRTLAVPA